MTLKIFDNIKNYKARRWIYLILFSLFASKSIFISPFTLKEGAVGIIIGFLIWISMFVLSTIALYFVSRFEIKTETNPTKFSRTFLYMIPGVIMSTIILLGVYPAIIPYDTGYIYYQSRIASFNSMHPIVYTMFIDFIARHMDSLTIVAVMQLIGCAFTYGYIGYVMEKNGINRKIAWIAVVVISLMPVNVIYSVTVIKDVPYIVPLIFITAVILDMILSDKISPFHVIGLVIASVIAWCSRFNALLTIPAVFASLALMYLIKKQLKRVMLIGASFILVFLAYKGACEFAEYQTHGDYNVIKGTSTIDIMPSVMLSHIAMEKYSELSEQEVKFAEEYINYGYIKERNANKMDSWLFNYNFMAVMDTEQIQNHKDEYYSQAMPIILRYPAVAFEAYEKITAIVWAVPNYGYTSARNAYVADCFQINHKFTDPILTFVFDFQKYNPLYSGQTLLFLWRPALWMLLILLLLPLAIKRHGAKSFVLLSPMLFNAAGYMVANPAQNVRYLYLNATVFIVFTIFTLIKSSRQKQ